MVTAKFSQNLACMEYEMNLGETAEQEEKLRNEVETVRQLTHLDEGANAGVAYEAAVLSEQDVSGLSLGSVMSCCMEDFLKS